MIYEEIQSAIAQGRNEKNKGILQVAEFLLLRVWFNYRLHSPKYHLIKQFTVLR